MKMNGARAAFAREHMDVTEVRDDAGKVVRRFSERFADSPSFRRWARDQFKRASSIELSPKLAKIVAQPGRHF